MRHDELNPLTADGQLSPATRQALRDDGYVLLPGLIPPALWQAALGRINGSLGSEGMAKEALPGFRARTYTPELCTEPALLDLFAASPLRAVTAAALGGESSLRPMREAQIALRFPAATGPATPHIDGIPYPGNGVPVGTLAHFTALAGVFLSPIDGPEQGNLTVWPGSHRLVEAHLRQHGPAGMVDGFPKLALGTPRAVTARPGDALLAHYALAHGIAPNRGPHIRYAVFFRVHHARHAEHGDRPLTDLWFEWPGVGA